VESLRQRCELQELELQKSTKKAQEAMALAAEESAKSKAAKEVIKSLTAQVFFLVYRLVSFELDFLEIVCSSLVNVLFVECFAR
jgi:hypothetical protein